MKTILVVDDQEAMRQLGKAMVEWCGYLAVDAASGAEAIAIIEEHREAISGVLLDMTMPGLSGEQTFSALRRIRPDLPVLATSGSAVEDLPDFMRGQEAVGFIPKPCNLQDLHRALTSVVEPGWREWPAREELAAHEPRNAARGW